MIDEYQVCRVAEDERERREQCLTGVFGEELKKKAENEGLSWIAYARWQKGNKVHRLDLLTAETIIEPPILWHKDRERLLDLRNRKQFVGLSNELEQELKQLEFRAFIHRETI